MDGRMDVTLLCVYSQKKKKKKSGQKEKSFMRTGINLI